METSVLLFLKSVIVGFAMCVPIGPIGVLVIRKTITQGKYHALVPGFGSMFAGLFYSFVAGLGIVFVTDFLTLHQKYLQLSAATILLLISINMLRAKPEKLMQRPRYAATFVANFFLGFFLALFNPATLFLITTLMAALNIISAVHSWDFAITVATGIFLGELSWWLFLTNAAFFAKKQFGRQAPITINTFSGLFLLILSTLLIIRIVVF